MQNPEGVNPSGETKTYQMGNLAALEMPHNDDPLRIFRPEDLIPITWRAEGYYRRNGVPDPSSLKGKQVCEVAPGLAEYALKCGNITIVEPSDYVSLRRFLTDIAAQTTYPNIRNIASGLARRAALYSASSRIRQVKRRVEDVAEELKGQFDVVICSHLLENVRNPGRVEFMLRELGRKNAQFFIW